MGSSAKPGDVSAMKNEKGNICQRIVRKQDSSPSKPVVQQASPAVPDKAASMYVESAEERRNMNATPATMPAIVHQGTMAVGGDESISEFGSPVSKKAAATKSKMKKHAPNVVPGDLDLSQDDLDIVNQVLVENIRVSSTSKKRKAASLKKPSASPKGSAKKSSFRHRKTSAAYHSAFKKAKDMGMPPNSCKAAGRSAAQDVSLKIDTGILTEEMEHK